MNIGFVGDIAFSGILCSDNINNNDRFKGIAPLLMSFDLTFANFEAPICSGFNFNEYKCHWHYTDELTAIELLKLFNIKCVSLANNHIYDCKMSGLQTTIETLDRLNIYHTGAGWLKEHVEHVIIEVKGVRVGFIAYVDRSSNPKTEFFPELLINYFDKDKVKSDVKNLKTKVDIVICSIHWGVDYSYFPTPNQVIDAREIIDSGVDIIMGHHPHTFQPFEKYKNGYIFYSLGGLVFGDYIREGKTVFQALPSKTKKTAIVGFDFFKKSIKFIPIKELKGNYIVFDKRNYLLWSKRVWVHYKIKNSGCLFNKLYNFQEKFLYRIYEYFFGYYKNPIKRLFAFSNIKKIKKLFE